jgi:CRISPR-associated endonuclease/helicase Cas3
MLFHELFSIATRKASPYPFQTLLAGKAWPDLLDVPTGMGKTAAVTLAWLWKRGWRQGERGAAIDDTTPRRLIWCLPMRVLVEQTQENIQTWLDNLGIGSNPGSGKVSVHVLMGGEEDLNTWAEHPEEDMILIGTQDMLLSRALMRGYGMSRYQWPVHFALLHNDSLWVFDEVQLMGAGLATSAQLEAFRRTFKLAKSSRSLWVSATLNKQWLDTVDLRPHLPLAQLGITEEDEAQAGNRLRAVKSLERATVTFDKAAGNKDGLKAYLQALCQSVLANHDTNAQTLVIVNSVARAQQLFRLLQEHRENKHDLLIHARFRANERSEQIRRLHDEPATDRIIVATQAIEAGVDISSKLLVTELAPWSSLVQRFGRCNRYGEYNKGGARILWIDIDDDADALPYTTETLAAARAKLVPLGSASAHDLPPTDEAPPLTAVLRRKDLLDLFNTDPDLSGFDVDVADYIRDSGNPGVQVFWRDFKNDPNAPELQGRPTRSELCPASLSQANAFRKRKDVVLWRWDSLDDRWIKLDRDPRPGMQLLARASDGGYDTALGFDAAVSRPPVEPLPDSTSTLARDYSGDWLSQQKTPVALTEHLAHVADHAAQLCGALQETVHEQQVVRAGRWHDLGKVHEVFQHSMYRCRLPVVPPLLAKSNCPGPMRHTRPYFRHELASMLGWLGQHDGEPDADLIAYLILAHHGKVRMSLRAMPDEYDKYPKNRKPTAKRFARGIWEGDTLPALDFDGERSAEITLRLALMEIGEGEQGPSWTERALRLLERHGPFQLAWLETLVRLADWRASAAEQQDDAA